VMDRSSACAWCVLLGLGILLRIPSCRGLYLPPRASCAPPKTRAVIQPVEEPPTMEEELTDPESHKKIRRRSIARVDKPPRLPVWPVVTGLVCTALDLLSLKDQAAWVEDVFGGRVAPMMLDAELADPFVLLVHHRHAFAPWDPVRPLFRLLIAEGFPAHPHVGFETVTMTLRGGLKHRDSFGVAETYADGDVQWLTAGRGVLHEEMWHGAQCELYQLWLNLPRAHKGADPRTVVLRAEDTNEDVDHTEDETATGGGRVRNLFDLGGSLNIFTEKDKTPGRRRARAGPGRPDVRLMRLELEPGATFSATVPADATVLAYCRKGRVAIGDDVLERHALAYTTKGAEALVIEGTSSEGTSDVLLLCGEPLREPVVASGTWVVSSERELELADRAYRAGRLGWPWDHELSDADWREWVAQYPPAAPDSAVAAAAADPPRSS